MFPGALRFVYEVARCGSVRGAGNALSVAPSSVSRQIKILERQLGTSLFVRTASGIELTHAGVIVAEYAKGVLLDYDSLRSDLNELRGVRRVLVRIAVVESMASEAPAIAIAGLRKKFEGISYKLRVLPAPQVTESVRSGSCDLGITYGLAPDIQLQTLYQLIEPVVVAMPLNHPLAQMKKVRLTELRNTPLALPDTDFGIREMIDRATRASGFEFEPVLSSNHFETLREFVRQGAGIALLPKRSAIPDQRRGQMCIVAVEDAVLEVATAAVITLKKRRLSKGTKLYVEELIKALQKLD